MKEELRTQSHFSRYQHTSNSPKNLCSPPLLWLMLVLPPRKQVISLLPLPNNLAKLSSPVQPELSSVLCSAPSLTSYRSLLNCVSFTGWKPLEVGDFITHVSTAPELADGCKAVCSVAGGVHEGGDKVETRELGWTWTAREKKREHSRQRMWEENTMARKPMEVGLTLW